MHLTSFVITALSLAAPLVSAEHLGPSRRHSSLAQRKRGDLVPRGPSFSGQATYYAVGLGSCGEYNGPNDFIVALNTPQYGGGYPGPNCFKSITIQARGKTAQAVIRDQCPGCGWGSLDLSEGLFRHFADLGDGVFPITWWFNDGNGGGNQEPAPTTTKKKPAKTSTWTPPATSTEWVDPSPWTTEKTEKTEKAEKTTKTKTKSKTATSTTESSTLTSSSTKKKSANSSTKVAQSSTSSAAVPSASANQVAPAIKNISQINQLVLGLAQLLKK